MDADLYRDKQDNTLLPEHWKVFIKSSMYCYIASDTVACKPTDTHFTVKTTWHGLNLKSGIYHTNISKGDKEKAIGVHSRSPKEAYITHVDILKQVRETCKEIEKTL